MWICSENPSYCNSNIHLEEQLMNFDKIWVDLFLDVSDSGFESVDSDEEL